jgi:hypothetical protein
MRLADFHATLQSGVERSWLPPIVWASCGLPHTDTLACQSRKFHNGATDKAIYPETIPAPVLIRQIRRFGCLEIAKSSGFNRAFPIEGCALFPGSRIHWHTEAERCIRLLEIDKAKKSDLLCLRFRGGSAIER